MTTKPAKDTIYLEADDEITVIIDRVLSAKSKVIALVLPKRASVFQSAVNMKLLKKSADQAKKHLVLISSEEAIHAMAGVAGVYIARSLTSKPEIPTSPKRAVQVTTIAADELEDQSKFPESTPEMSLKPPEEDIITMDGSDAPEAATESVNNPEASDDKPKHTKRVLKIPDFTSFRTKLALGGLVVALIIGGWIYGFVIAPKAVVTINVNTSKTTVSYQFTASAGVEELDSEKRVVPAKLSEVTKESSAKIPATGQKNVGVKATGTGEFTTKVCAPNLGNSPDDIAAGTVVSTGGRSYSVQTDVEFQFNGLGGSCANYISDDVQIVAQEPGVSSNVNAASLTVSGRQDVSGTGSAGGGTDDIKTIVSADDIKNATAQLKGSTGAEAAAELKNQLESEGLMALDQTLEEGTPAVKNNPSEGVEAAEVTVTQTVVYKMLGVKSDDLKTILDAELAKQLEEQQNTKKVRDNGFSTAALRFINRVSSSEQIVELQTVSTFGEEFNKAEIANQVSGKPRGEIQKMLESREGVNSVDVSYSPAWVTTTPKKASKITVQINEE